jgi:hypothetical protein
MWQNFTKAVRDLQLTFRNALDPYRPELCYMRGPGPACRAKSSTGNGTPSQSCKSTDLGLYGTATTGDWYAAIHPSSQHRTL